MNSPLEMTAAYLEGKLNETQVAEFEAWLRKDRDRAKAFVRQAMLDSHLTELMHEDNVTHVATDLSDDSKLGEMFETPTSSASTPSGQELPPIHLDANKLTRQQYISAMSYVVRHTFTPKRIATLATAAALMLGVVLAITMLTGPDDTDTFAEVPDAPATPNMPTESAPPILRDHPGTTPGTPPVATLTATHNAQWSGGPASAELRIGDTLHPNQRLTLTAGFAEITTNRGAIAILEAPATIELTDSPNAMRLHAGKLVGICETESSKGFVVRTPHMDITDLGTRFGVDATAAGQTRVKVFEGEVEAALTAPVSDQPQQQRLTSGHALAAQTGIGWTPAAYEPNRFVMDMTTDRLRPEFAGTNAVWLGRVSHDLEQDKQEADALQVFIEQRGLMLAQAVPTDFDSKQEWDPRLGVGQQRVEAGKRVDVYLLHYDLVAGHESPEEFVINFDRPILGVIGAQETLNATDASLGSPKASYPHFEVDRDTALGARGINPPGFGKHPHEEDIVSISADGTQLRLRLWGGTPEQVSERTAKMDQLRVIVQAVEAAP